MVTDRQTHKFCMWAELKNRDFAVIENLSKCTAAPPAPFYGDYGRWCDISTLPLPAPWTMDENGFSVSHSLLDRLMIVMLLFDLYPVLQHTRDGSAVAIVSMTRLKFLCEGSEQETWMLIRLLLSSAPPGNWQLLLKRSFVTSFVVELSRRGECS